MNNRKKNVMGIVFVISLGIIALLFIFTASPLQAPSGDGIESAPTSPPLSASSTLSEADARTIAESSCIKGGEALGPGSYNDYTRTWWFNANLNATKPGCNPACVVREDTNTAEVNWRCTGVIPPGSTSTPTPVSPPPRDGTGGNVVCTADAKLCPDGSYVGRIPPSCAFAPCPTSETGRAGSIVGTVLVGPTCPVQRIGDTTCDDKPYAGTVQVVRAGSPSSAPVAMVNTDAVGAYSASVPYGSYTVVVLTPGMFPRCTSVDVTVDSTIPVTANISCDSGIR